MADITLTLLLFFILTLKSRTIEFKCLDSTPVARRERTQACIRQILCNGEPPISPLVRGPSLFQALTLLSHREVFRPPSKLPSAYCPFTPFFLGHSFSWFDPIPVSRVSGHNEILRHSFLLKRTRRAFSPVHRNGP